MLFILLTVTVSDGPCLFRQQLPQQAPALSPIMSRTPNRQQQSSSTSSDHRSPASIMWLLPSWILHIHNCSGRGVWEPRSRINRNHTCCNIWYVPLSSSCLGLGAAFPSDTNATSVKRTLLEAIFSAFCTASVTLWYAE